jgi:CO/xanthine dehydrogenase Mo-binding subunit
VVVDCGLIYACFGNNGADTGFFIAACIYDSRGHMDNPGFLDYRIPVASDLPMIETVMVEVPNPGHPYGAKGAAEVNICPPMAAIANAIERATGQRLTELPMSPPKVLAAIDARERLDHCPHHAAK